MDFIDNLRVEYLDKPFPFEFSKFSPIITVEYIAKLLKFIQKKIQHLKNFVINDEIKNNLDKFQSIICFLQQDYKKIVVEENKWILLILYNSFRRRIIITKNNKTLPKR
jgi:bifunctional ADP-heptose synthase (sugar kinase/adenylyltransferase)